MMSLGLDELDTNIGTTYGFIRSIEMKPGRVPVNKNVVSSLTLNMSGKDFVLAVMSALYLMKEAYPIVYINVLDTYLKVEVLAYGVPAKEDLHSVVNALIQCFEYARLTGVVGVFETLLEEVNNGSFVFEE